MRQVFGVMLVLSKELQASLQQNLQLGVLGARDEGPFQSPVYRLVVGDFIGDIVERWNLLAGFVNPALGGTRLSAHCLLMPTRRVSVAPPQE